MNKEYNNLITTRQKYSFYYKYMNKISKYINLN